MIQDNGAFEKYFINRTDIKRNKTKTTAVLDLKTIFFGYDHHRIKKISLKRQYHRIKYVNILHKTVIFIHLQNIERIHRVLGNKESTGHNIWYGMRGMMQVGSRQCQLN